MDAATVSTDDIDTGYTDIGVDGLVGLYGEVGYSETTGIDDAHVGLTTERRGDANHVLTDSEYEVALTEVVARRVFIITEGERRVVAVEEDRACVLTGTDTTGHEVRAERYGCGTASRRHVEAAASGIHQVAVDLLAHVVRHEGIAIDSCCRHLAIADSNGDARLRDEADGLLGELCWSRRCRVLGCPRTAEVELIVGLAREADDIRLGSSQQRILCQCAACLVIRLVGVSIGILMVVACCSIIVIIPEEGVANSLGGTCGIREVEDGGEDASG